MQQSLTDPPALNAGRDKELAALLAAAAGGDAGAFESFYNGTVRYAIAVVRRIAGDTHTEDVLSDCYFQAWRNAAQFDPARGSALGWLLTMARSRALDRLRAESLRHGGLAGAPEFDTEAVESGAALGPEALLESVQASSQLHAALSQLSANERWVLGLAYFRDHSQSEIAAITGLPLGTVKSLVNRAQHKLREVLQA
jgi:RNA polymerase sigma-70 factor (ECF subfamily)